MVMWTKQTCTAVLLLVLFVVFANSETKKVVGGLTKLSGGALLALHAVLFTVLAMLAINGCSSLEKFVRVRAAKERYAKAKAAKERYVKAKAAKERYQRSRSPRRENYRAPGCASCSR